MTPILSRIGDTTMLPLRHLVPRNGARILLKLESENPTGSMKDRMALGMIETAEADGRLAPGGAVVEYTGGSTGVSLAWSAPSSGTRCTPSARTRSRRRSSTTCASSAPSSRSSSATAVA